MSTVEELEEFYREYLDENFYCGMRPLLPSDLLGCPNYPIHTHCRVFETFADGTCMIVDGNGNFSVRAIMVDEDNFALDWQHRFDAIPVCKELGFIIAEREHELAKARMAEHDEMATMLEELGA